MVGQGVLRECFRNLEVESTVAIGRTPTGMEHPKLREIVHGDMQNYTAIEGELSGFDACFFCLGISSSGMTEAEYARITYTFTMAAAEPLSRLNPHMVFVYVSGQGTDSSEKGRVMWARVKGRTENALLRLPFSAYMFRPGLIQPLDGIESKTRVYRVFYAVFGPLLTVLRRALPNLVLTTRQIGLAMLAVAKFGYEKQILETKDIRTLLSR
jgi:uncharacterized protein YbjT (DUF2867 family)